VFRVVDPDLRTKVRDDFAKQNAAAAQAYDDADRAAYEKLKLSGLDAAPEHLAVFTETAPVEGRGLGRQTMPQTLEQSTAMAIYSLWLMARACNIGVGMVSIIDPDGRKTQKSTGKIADHRASSSKPSTSRCVSR
jgi:nitroreductase